MSFTLTSPRLLIQCLTTGYLISLEGIEWMGNCLNGSDPFLQTGTNEFRLMDPYLHGREQKVESHRGPLLFALYVAILSF